MASFTTVVASPLIRTPIATLPRKVTVVAASVASRALQTMVAARTRAAPWGRAPGVATRSRRRWKTIRLTVPYLPVQSIRAAVRTQTVLSRAIAIWRLLIRVRTIIIRFVLVWATGLAWPGIRVTVLPWRGGRLRTLIPRTETWHRMEKQLALVELKNLTAIFHVGKQLNRVINSLCLKSICKPGLFNIVRITATNNSIHPILFTLIWRKRVSLIG